MNSPDLWMEYNSTEYADAIVTKLKAKGYTVRTEDVLNGFWMTKVTVENVRGSSKQSEVAKLLSPGITGGHAHYTKRRLK